MSIRYFKVILLTLFVLFFSHNSLSQNTTPSQRPLDKYMQAYPVSKLEWNLLMFNIVWQNSYTGCSDYVNSFPAIADFRNQRIHVSFRVCERRDARDPQPFFSLSRAEKQAVLTAPIDYLKLLLVGYFPEVTSNPKMLYVEFNFQRQGGGSGTVAVFENGLLRLNE